MPRSLHPSPRTGALTRFVPPATALTSLLICCGSALAQTITVTTLNDVVDFASPQQVANLPGPDGKVSFREACLAVSNTPGAQTIEFAVPQSEWWLVSNMAVLRLEQGVFVITGSAGGKHGDGTILDFTTQANFTGETNPNGNEVGIYGLQPNGWGSPAIVLNADNVLVKGLGNVWQRGNAVSIRGNNNKVQGCAVSSTIHAAIEIGGNYGGLPASNNLIGGMNEGDGNILSGATGVRIINPATDNVIVGNRLSGSDIGVWIIGNQYTGYVYNNRVGGPTPQERNIIADAGSYCCEGAPSGGQVMIEWAVDTIVEDNYIGTTPDGMSGAGQIGPRGIQLRRAPGIKGRRAALLPEEVASGRPQPALCIKSDEIHVHVAGNASVARSNDARFGIRLKVSKRGGDRQMQSSRQGQENYSCRFASKHVPSFLLFLRSGCVVKVNSAPVGENEKKVIHTD